MKLAEKMKTAKELYGFIILNEGVLEKLKKEHWNVKWDVDGHYLDVLQNEIDSKRRNIEYHQKLFGKNENDIEADREATKRVNFSSGLKQCAIITACLLFLPAIMTIVYLSNLNAEQKLKSIYMWMTIIIWILFVLIDIFVICKTISSTKTENIEEQSKKPSSASITPEQELMNMIENRNLEVEKHKKVVIIKEPIMKELESQIIKLEDSIAKMKKVLNKILDDCKVHEQYRSYVCICQFYQYLDTGRCKEFTGANGCYNLYEMELRLGLIIDNLERINNSLDEIKQSMHQLVQIQREINARLKIISDEISDYIKNENTRRLSEYSLLQKDLRLVKSCVALSVKDQLPPDARINSVREVFLNSDYF